MRLARYILVFFLFVLSTPSPAADITSGGTGLWSLAATWNGGMVPGPADRVSIRSGDTVTVDITTATASTTTVSGTLSFSRVSSSSFTMVAGSMTVNGTLDMGSEASPIPAGIKAHLVLAYGRGASRYGLTVNNGGNFTVRGATKTPYGFALANIPASGTSLTIAASSATGWQEGDAITIGPTTGDGVNTTSTRTITSITGTDPLTVNWTGVLGTARTISSTSPIVVANLTRNVLVRSSGTDTATAGTGSTAYIRNLVQNTTSFSLVCGEFAYLGRNTANQYGITFNGALIKGSISSSTIREGYRGIYLNNADNNTFAYNLIYKNSDNGIFLDNSADNNTLLSNNVYANTNYSIYAFASNNDTLTSNYSYSNADTGIYLFASIYSRISSNHSYSNTGYGFWTQSSNGIINSNHVYANAWEGMILQSASGNTVAFNRSYANFIGIITMSDADDNLFVSNEAYANTGVGLRNNTSSGNTFIANNSYSNSGRGIYVTDTGFDLTIAEGGVGYDAAGNLKPNATAEVAFDGIGTVQNAVMKHVRVNPSPGIAASGFNQAGTYLLSYNQDYATGTVRLWGDYLVSASTLTLDYASQLYTSTATAPKLMRGTGHSASVCSTDDTGAVSQLITIERVSGSWNVTGSSTGFMGTITSGGSCPAGTSFGQFNLVLTEGAPQNGDIVDFALIAASQDQNIKKNLYFGPSDSAFNSGKSRLRVDPNAGFSAVGGSSASDWTFIDRLNTASTYYTFIASGTFTVSYSSFANADPGGIQLAGSGGISMSNAAFDYMGLAGGTNTYITARSLTSTATFTTLNFHTSRSTAGFASAYNVRVEGNDSGTSWDIVGGTGSLWGESLDDDGSNRITWTPQAVCGNTTLSLSAVYTSSITAAWNSTCLTSYTLQASSASDFSGTIFISSTSTGATSLAVSALTPNTTYTLRLLSNPSDTVSTVTLAAQPSPLSFTGISPSALTINWPSNNNPNDTSYEAAISTDINFLVFQSSLATSSLSAAFPALSANTTYFARVRAFNRSGTPTAYSPGAVITVGGVITISANRLPSVWYNNGSAVFNAQGAVSYNHSLTANAGDIPTAADPAFDGSALTLALPQGAFYFHVRGLDGVGNPLGSAHFGPLQTDAIAPIVASIAAQKSAADSTAIPDGGSTLSATPRFTWPAAISASPVVGYSLLVSTNAADQPGTGITTTLAFSDQFLPQAGTYHAKLRALNLAGNTGPVVGMSFSFTTTPAADNLVLKKNYFNPLRGECLKVEVQVASSGRLKMEFYTALGDKVSTLADHDVGPGVYNHRWCGTTASGRLVASGVYFLNIEAPNQKKTFKVGVAK